MLVLDVGVLAAHLVDAALAWLAVALSASHGLVVDDATEESDATLDALAVRAGDLDVVELAALVELADER